MLIHDNARPHSANLAKNTTQELGWEVIPHPPYSPDVASSDFNLFSSLSNNLQGTSFPGENVLRTWLEDFYSKPRDFYTRGIEKFLQRWQTVVNSEGDDLFLSYVCLMCSINLWKIATELCTNPIIASSI